MKLSTTPWVYWIASHATRFRPTSVSATCLSGGSTASRSSSRWTHRTSYWRCCNTKTMTMMYVAAAGRVRHPGLVSPPVVSVQEVASSDPPEAALANCEAVWEAVGNVLERNPHLTDDCLERIMEAVLRYFVPSMHQRAQVAALTVLKQVSKADAVSTFVLENRAFAVPRLLSLFQTLRECVAAYGMRDVRHCSSQWWVCDVRVEQV